MKKAVLRKLLKSRLSDKTEEKTTGTIVSDTTKPKRKKKSDK